MIIKIDELEDFMKGNSGSLMSFLKDTDLENKRFQQIYISTIPPNITRGNHYHKKRSEYLVILSGQIELIVEDINTKERKIEIIDTKPYRRIMISPNVAHCITNISDETVTIVEYVTQAFDPNNIDRFEYKLK